MAKKRDRFQIVDMTCPTCERKIENAVWKLPGTAEVKASYACGSVRVVYDETICNATEIIKTIREAGYTVAQQKFRQQFSFSKTIRKMAVFLFILAIIFLANNLYGSYNLDDKLKDNVSYAVLFLAGIFTSFHCVGMCGGIMLSQNGTHEEHRLKAILPTIFYNTGRILSYTVLGGLVGALGSVISISLRFKVGIMIFAGIFMIIMGLNMSGVTLFRKIYLKLPWTRHSAPKTSRGPFIVGMLNGLLPCGPLQTMQLYALGTGSAFKGALAMFIFALGTIPLMISLGTISGLSHRFAGKFVKYSAALVIILGLVMTNRGLTLAGVNTSFTNALLPKVQTASAAAVKAELNGGIQNHSLLTNREKT